MLSLHTLHHPKGAKHRKKIIGRGNASGHGTYAGRGQKGQKARTGGTKGLKRKGIRMMLLRIPKRRGIGNPAAERIDVVNLGVIDPYIKDGARVDVATLAGIGFVQKGARRIKILGDGAWTKKGVVFAGISFSNSARAKVLAAGCTITGKSTLRHTKSVIRPPEVDPPLADNP